LRLNDPFEDLISFVEEFNLETLPPHLHSHVPYVVILIKAISKYKATVRIEKCSLNNESMMEKCQEQWEKRKNSEEL
jgi:hypothetical protein